MIPDRFVVDSRVGIKWFVPEVHSADAFRLQAPGRSRHIPAFFNVERLREYRQTLISAALTGKINVTGEAG
jgi:hypothetical protein